MSDDAALILRLEARTRKFEKDLAKAIDKLEGNVKRGNRQFDKGMSKMERRGRKAAKTLKDTFASVTGIGTLGVAAGAAFGVTAVNNTLNYAKEVQNLADIAGVSAERFQELSFAGDRFGISQEKISDIMKDVNDKVADFLITGGGPMADFFEQVAPKIGLTEDAFRGLSSDQAMGLYISSLEKAGASQQDMTFFMEALASDATALLPLFKNNGAELENMAKRGRELGVVIDNDLIEKGASARQKLDELTASLGDGLRGAIIELAPEIEEITDDLIDALPQMLDWTKAIVKSFANIGGALEKLEDIYQASFIGQGRGDKDPTDAKGAAKRLERLIALKTHLNTLEEGKKGGILAFGLDDVTAKRSSKVLGVKLFGEEAFKELKDDAEAFKAAVQNEFDYVQSLREHFLQEELDAEKKAEEKKAAAAEEKRKRDEERRKARLGGPGIQRDTSEDPEVKKSDAALQAIRELGRTEKEQIEDVLQTRLSAIESSKVAEEEKNSLRKKAHAEAKRELLELKQEQDSAEQQRLAEVEALRSANFSSLQDQLSYLAEIEAIKARMAGRAVEATNIELNATRERYEAELAYVEELIQKHGETDQLLADRANAQAGIAQTDQSQQDVNTRASEEFDALAGRDFESELQAELEFINEKEAAKLERLEELRTEELEALKNFEEQKRLIEEEADKERLEARFAAMRAQLNGTKDLLSGVSSAISAAGKENTKAAKIAAKAQQVISLGNAFINTAEGVTEALGAGNIPKAILVGALGAIQIGVIASQTFDGGGFTGRGARSGGVDGKGGYHAIVHPNETIVDHTKPGREVNGKSIEEAFGLNGSTSLGRGVSPSSISGRGRSGNSFRGGDLVVQGNVDKDVLPELQAKMDRFLQNQERDFNRMSDARERRTTPRTDRRVGRGAGR